MEGHKINKINISFLFPLFFYLKKIARSMHNDGLNLPKIIKRLRFFRPAQSHQTTADRVQEVQIP